MLGNRKLFLGILAGIVFLAGCSKNVEKAQESNETESAGISETADEDKEEQYGVNRAAISFVIDDGYEDVLENKEIFDKYGMKGCLAVITGFLGRDIYLTKEEVIGLSQDGWEIVSHTNTHPAGWDTIEESTVEEEYSTSLSTLRRMGISVKGIAIPNIYIPSRLIPITEDYFSYCMGTTDEESDFVFPRYHMTVLDENGQTDTENAVENMKRTIDEMIEKQEYRIFFFHYTNIHEPWMTSPDMNEEMLDAVLSYLYERKEDIDVITPGEYFLGE